MGNNRDLCEQAARQALEWLGQAETCLEAQDFGSALAKYRTVVEALAADIIRVKMKSEPPRALDHRLGKIEKHQLAPKRICGQLRNVQRQGNDAIHPDHCSPDDMATEREASSARESVLAVTEWYVTVFLTENCTTHCVARARRTQELRQLRGKRPPAMTKAVVTLGVGLAAAVFLGLVFFGGFTSNGPDEQRHMATQTVVEESLPGPVWRVFSVSSLSLKEEPALGKKGRKIGELPEGARLALLRDVEQWRQVEVLDGEFEGRQGYVHRCCVKPADADDFFIARLSEIDHFSRAGARLETVAEIIDQDRANFHDHGGADRHDEDRRDERLADAKRREKLRRLIEKTDLSEEATRRIIHGTPKVQVAVWPDRAEVIVLEDEDWLSDRFADSRRREFRECLRTAFHDSGNWPTAWRECDAEPRFRDRSQKRKDGEVRSCSAERKECYPDDYPPPLHPLTEADCDEAFQRCIRDAVFDPWNWPFLE